MPTPGMSQPMIPGMQPVGMSAIQAGKPKNVKFWEGMLSGRPKGQLNVMARIMGYRDASKSDTLASNWPETLEIVDFISPIDMRKMLLDKAEMIVFHTTYQHLLLSKIQKLAGVILLPSQTLLVTFSDKPRILIGGLLPGDTVPLTSTTPAEDLRQNPAAERSRPGETSKPDVEEKPSRPMRKRNTSAKPRRR